MPMSVSVPILLPQVPFTRTGRSDREKYVGTTGWRAGIPVQGGEESGGGRVGGSGVSEFQHGVSGILSLGSPGSGQENTGSLGSSSTRSAQSEGSPGVASSDQSAGSGDIGHQQPGCRETACIEGTVLHCEVPGGSTYTRDVRWYKMVQNSTSSLQVYLCHTLEHFTPS